MINDIYPHQFSNKYIIPDYIENEDYILHYNKNSLLLKITSDGYRLPEKKDFPEEINSAESHYLFSIDGARCFLIWNGPKDISDQFGYKDVSFFRSLQPQEIAWVAIVGFQLMSWYSQNKFCGRCGSMTTEKPDERAMVCPCCSNITYPKISPAIIVAIISDNKILLAHNSNFDENRYSLVAGYADIGETLEDTVRREVMEEVGLAVRNIRYYQSQPWPFSGSLMIGFTAEADEGQPISPDGVEITEAKWFSRGNLPNYPPKISIAGEMIDRFENGTL